MSGIAELRFETTKIHQLKCPHSLSCTSQCLHFFLFDRSGALVPGLSPMTILTSHSVLSDLSLTLPSVPSTFLLFRHRVTTPWCDPESHSNPVSRDRINSGLRLKYWSLPRYSLSVCLPWVQDLLMLFRLNLSLFSELCDLMNFYFSPAQSRVSAIPVIKSSLIPLGTDSLGFSYDRYPSNVLICPFL